MLSLQMLWEDKVKEVPQWILADILKKKLAECDIECSNDFYERLSAHIWSGSKEPFHWDDEKGDRDIQLTVDDNDIQELTRRLERFQEELPEVLIKAAKQLARMALPELRRKWQEEQTQQFNELSLFRKRIEKRWGKPLGKLRMLLTMARELGNIVIEEEEPESEMLHGLMVRLHVRCCQVTTEIITLLENGLADGAMARWRTLHEIAIVMELLDQYGEPLAIRYLDHQAVEAKTAMDQYQSCYESLGYDGIAESDRKVIDDDYTKVMQKYGKFFRTPYGWAEGFVPPNSRGAIGLGELEAAAGQSILASHYKLASSNIHAGPNALFFRLGLIGDAPLLSGASDAGFAEPGQNTALTFLLASAAVSKQSCSFEAIWALEMMTKLMAEIPASFSRAAAKLENDYARYSDTHNRR